MIRRTVTIPQLGLIAGTRAALGAGLGLLLADKLSREQRHAVGWTLVAVGALTTIPLVADVIIHGRQPADSSHDGRAGLERGIEPELASA